jgi:hypothetical protein
MPKIKYSNYTKLEKKLDNLAIAEVAKEKPAYAIKRSGEKIRKKAVRYHCVSLCQERLENMDFFFKKIYHIAQSPVTLMALFGVKLISNYK